MTTLAARNGRTAALAALLVAAMVGLAFASVPLYRLFCQVTGFGGTPLRAEQVDSSLKATGKLIYVRFDANTNSALPWAFEPEQHQQRVAIGARDMAFYTARI
jgi:cytochrome c oxidase assembly protein subunit 11